jgi:hypothetical protein
VTDDVRVIHFVLPITAGQTNASEPPDFNLFRDLALTYSQPTGNHWSFAFLANSRAEMETLYAHVRQCTEVGPSRQANLTLYRDRRSVEHERVVLIPLSDLWTKSAPLKFLPLSNPPQP